MTTPNLIASKAASIVATLKQTHYQFREDIDAEEGRFDCDCNGFVGFVLESKDVAPRNYDLIPKEAGKNGPRAFEYYDYFASLAPTAATGWRRVDALTQVSPGDIVAWRFATTKAGENTGHVMIVADTPTVIAAGIYSVRVYDSAANPHFDDTRGSGKRQFPNGVGAGKIHFRLDGEGRPIAFLFGPPSTADFTYLPIDIGRALPIPSATSTVTSDTVLDNLKPDSPLQAQISATLNAALRTQLADAASAAKLPVLVSLINAMPPGDLVAAKDLSLQAFAQQQVDPMVASDPSMKVAVDNEIAKLPLTSTVSTALDLTSPLTSHPLLKRVRADAQIRSLLAASPAITSDMQQPFITLYNANSAPISDFWSQLAKDPQLGPVVPELQRNLQLGTLTNNIADLVAKLVAQ